MKTGGRVKGSLSTPKVATHVTTAVAAGAPPGGEFLSTIKKTFPAYRIERTDRLVPYANNARTHSAAQVELIAKMITEYGFTNPVLVDGKRGIIAGHGRVLAARQLGMDVVPVIELSHLSAEQKRAYVIADNASALKAGWDDELLRLELGELRDAGFDLALTGFDLGELGALFGDGAEGLTDPDDVPEPPTDPVTRLGDVWLLGRHRLHCGDCRDILPGLTGIDAVVTDPPYGIGAAMKGGTWGAAIKYATMRGWDTAPPADVFTKLLGYRALVVWGGNYFALPPSRCWLIWDKQNAVRTMADCELGWTSFDPVVADCDMAWTNLDRPVKRLSLPVGTHDTGHPTQKPAALMKWSLSFVKGETILDPFVGSGTTIIAAEMTGRACHAIELSPAYVDVAVLRWQAFSGQQAVLESDGQTFAEITAARVGVRAA